MRWRVGIIKIFFFFFIFLLSQYNVALFHVINHAFFKALLFLSAGAVIHSFSDQQDVRRVGGLIKLLPFTYTAILVGTLSLLATPWLTGFYSKDLIIELALGQYSISGSYAYIIGSLTAMFTAFYSFRLISLVFLTEPNGSKFTYLNSHESNLNVIIPLFILAVFSIFFGFVFSDLFVGIGTDFFGNSIFSHPNNISIIESEFSLPVVLKILPTLLSLVGALLALYLYQNNTISLINITETKTGKKLYTFLNGKYFFDILYNNYIISNGLHLGYYISKVLDRGIIELIGPFGLSTLFINTSKNIAKLDTGIITTYSLYITLAFLSLLFLVFAPLLIDTIPTGSDLSANRGTAEPELLNEIRLFIIYIASLLLIM